VPGRPRGNGELCIAGDFKQEWGANGPVGTRVGRAAFERILDECRLSCVTGGNLDPLQAREYRSRGAEPWAQSNGLADGLARAIPAPDIAIRPSRALRDRR